MNKAMSAISSRWARHQWNLYGIDFSLSLPPGYEERNATNADAIRVLDIVLRAYGSDAVWQSHLPAIATRMHHRIRQTLGHPGAAYLLVVRGDEVVAVSGVAVSHWTDQNLLTGVCVHPNHQRRGVGRFLLGRSLQWLQTNGVLEPQVYTETGSLADRKIYPLYGSTRVVGVAYPRSQEPPPNEAYAVNHNRYFDGRVQSLGFATPYGYATTGVITPGRYEFTADYEEHVLILSGILRVKLPGRDWVEVPANDAYVVPAGTQFEVESETDVSYLCRYYSRRTTKG
jgi:purine/pyrimidine-nucleoside phosphorylase